MALLRSELNIPHPGYDPDGESHTFYTAYYKYSGRDRRNKEWENKDDSPDESRASLMKRIHPLIDSLPKGSRVLDLGAGRQIFEREYEETYGNKPICQIVTLDIASIQSHRLLAEGYPHVQATGRSLPFRDGQFDAVISNMAFDFMLPEALPELRRVAKSGASIFLNLHHPSLVKYDIDRKLTQVARTMRHEGQFIKTNNEKLRLKRAVFLHHKHLRDNRLLFETQDQIKAYFDEGGFDTTGVEIKSNQSDKWWEVDLVKSSKSVRKLFPLAGVVFDGGK